MTCNICGETANEMAECACDRQERAMIYGVKIVNTFADKFTAEDRYRFSNGFEAMHPEECIEPLHELASGLMLIIDHRLQVVPTLSYWLVCKGMVCARGNTLEEAIYNCLNKWRSTSQ